MSAPDQDAHAGNKPPAEADLTRAPESSVAAVMGCLGLTRQNSQPTTDELTLARDLTDPAWIVRVETAQQLGKLGKQVPLELLLVGLRDEQSSVRVAAARALGHNPRQSALPALVATLDDSEWLVRAEAALALGKLPEFAPLEPLLVTIHDPDASVRAATTWTLGEIGKEHGSIPLFEALKLALQDSDWSVREAATLVVGQLEQQENIAFSFKMSQTDEATETATISWSSREIEVADKQPLALFPDKVAMEPATTHLDRRNTQWACE